MKILVAMFIFFMLCRVDYNLREFINDYGLFDDLSFVSKAAAYSVIPLTLFGVFIYYLERVHLINLF